MTLPTDSKDRKDTPIVRGVLDYFPDAIAAVARVSKAGNDKHNPGEEMHHARGKSTDHADCIVRHLMDRGHVDLEDGHRHTAKVAWRALALLQEELEREEGVPLARGAREAWDWSKNPDDDVPECPAAVCENLRLQSADYMERIAGECPNVIEERIAGDTGRAIKKKYYGVFEEGDDVECDDGWRGTIIRGPFDFASRNYVEVYWHTHPDGTHNRDPNFTTQVATPRLRLL